MTRTMIRTKAAPFNDGSIEPNLGSRYGEIGISAVTAALQYKNPGRLQTRLRGDCIPPHICCARHAGKR